jgi:hypothetical protein
MTGNGTLTEIPQAKRFDLSLLDDAPEPMEISSLGGGLKILENCKPVELDHEFATWLLSLPDFSGDRKLDQNWVMKLKLAMENGTFLPEQVIAVTCRLQTDGKTYRCNTQHCSSARLLMPEKYRCPIRHTRYSAKTENDLRRLYASIDRGKPRTKSNVVTAYLFETEEWSGFGKHVIGWVSEGMSLWLWPSRHEQAMHSGDDRAYLLMTDHLRLGKLVASFIQQHQSPKIKFLRRVPVVAAMFATFKKDPHAALEFWSRVADGTGFTSADDPRRVLRDGLMSSVLRVEKTTKRSVGQEEMYRWSIYSFNAYKRGEPMKILRANLSLQRPEPI